MAPWVWICVGVSLLVLEVLIQTEFWLVFIGLAALLVGGLTSAGLGGPLWAQWVALATFSVLLTVFFRKRIHEKFVHPAPGVGPELVGERVLVHTRMDTGATGSVEHRGSTWPARNTGTTPIEANTHATIQQVSGIELEIQA